MGKGMQTMMRNVAVKAVLGRRILISTKVGPQNWMLLLISTLVWSYVSTMYSLSQELLPPTDCPSVEFTFVPNYGSSEDLKGRIHNVDPNDFKIAVYIFVEGSGWWTKPTFAEALTPIGPDSTWTTDITTGGNDAYATKIHASLLPNGIEPPLSNGLAILPASLDSLSIADVDTTRNPRSIRFSGYEWLVKASAVKVGPGPNYFSDSMENVWVDNDGQLHLKITNRNGEWQCSEVILDSSLCYGSYVFKVGSKVGQINENAVLGLFTWDNDAPNEFYREVDIEFSPWGVVTDPNAQYVVQPWNRPGNRHRWMLPDTLELSTHSFEWSADRISFVSAKGHQISSSDDSVIHSWMYTGANIPTCGAENVRINLWLFNGYPPTDNSEIEVIISKFEYTKLDTDNAIDQVTRSDVSRYSLLQNYPNPFNSSTVICFELSRPSKVSVELFDVLGHKIRTLVNSSLASGSYTTIWDGRNQNLLLMPSGVYLMRMQADKFSTIKKLMFLR
jgi:hypothetical protein